MTEPENTPKDDSTVKEDSRVTADLLDVYPRFKAYCLREMRKQADAVRFLVARGLELEERERRGGHTSA